MVDIGRRVVLCVDGCQFKGVAASNEPKSAALKMALTYNRIKRKCGDTQRAVVVSPQVWCGRDFGVVIIGKDKSEFLTGMSEGEATTLAEIEQKKHPECLVIIADTRKQEVEA